MTDTETVPASAAPPEIRADLAFPGILPSVGWIILYFLLQGLCTAGLLMTGIGGEVGGKIGGAGPGGVASAMGNPIVFLWGLLLAAFIQLSLMAIYLRKHGRVRMLGLHDFGQMPVLRAIGLAILLVLAAMAFNLAYATFVIPGIGMQEEMAKMLAAIPRTWPNITAGFFAIAVAAPLVEELLFRGMLQNALARRIPIWGAIILSSLAFAAVHLQFYAIPGLMSLSIAFGYLYHRTGSLRMNIMLHMANNAFALLLTQGMS